ncbi:hypothetical protein Emin_0229 [Elusimicrobium minutum Pei191]|uniref:Uncharacterized protein n=1 Tax=Elusimicrobium minutum (strain Pei191) TaxID=445932 RepID=B2KB32_ELUMP|nr:hypothetical protein [Elusimicrobium minutum]ACC97791.1 hypothetical protein Emin_0229 [Elusimicrobium minutum Pei191]
MSTSLPENANSTQKAIFKDYGVVVTEEEAFEIKRSLIGLIRLLDKVDRELGPES